MKTKVKRKQYSPEFKSEALKLVAKTSVASAAKELGIYEKEMTPDQIVEAQKLAREWMARHSQ